MSKHVKSFVPALLAYGTAAARVAGMKKALSVGLKEAGDIAALSDADKARLDLNTIKALTQFYVDSGVECEYWPVQKGGKLSFYTITQGTPSVALSAIRKVIEGKVIEKKVDERTPAEKHAAVMIAMLESGDKAKKADAVKWIKRLAAHLTA
jgi:hypothetical protein